MYPLCKSPCPTRGALLLPWCRYLVLPPQIETLRLAALEEQARLVEQAAMLAAELEEARAAAAAAEPLVEELLQVRRRCCITLQKAPSMPAASLRRAHQLLCSEP